MGKNMRELLFFLPQTNPTIPVTFGEELERNVGIALYITQFAMGFSYKAKTVCPHKHLKR